MVARLAEGVVERLLDKIYRDVCRAVTIRMLIDSDSDTVYCCRVNRLLERLRKTQFRVFRVK